VDTKQGVGIGRRPIRSQDAETIAAGFAALADPIRLRLFDLIRRTGSRGMCSCDMLEPIGRSQPTVSHHLKVLREAGLVESRREGTWQWYTATADSTDKLVQFLS